MLLIQMNQIYDAFTNIFNMMNILRSNDTKPLIDICDECSKMTPDIKQRYITLGTKKHCSIHHTGKYICNKRSNTAPEYIFNYCGNKYICSGDDGEQGIPGVDFGILLGPTNY